MVSTGVACPQGDDCNTDARLQEFHGGGVAQNMGRYFLALQRWTLPRGCPDVLRQQVLNSIAAHSPSLAVREYDLSVAMRRFLQPRLHYRCRLFRHRCAASLAAFADHVNMSACPKLNVGPGQACQF